MCGIAGIFDLDGHGAPEPRDVSRMLASIRHRGPDQFGMYLDERIALGSARLSIIDLADGRQPITNEDGSLWIVFNGEIFNYVELRPWLESRGHRFSTHTDTEVILHLYEELGPDCLAKLNGQFAIAIWDRRTRSLFLARDRVGVRPLFYTLFAGRLVFGSEIKCLLNAVPSTDIDPFALDEIFTFWSTLSPRTAFRNISEIPPGHYLTIRNGDLRFTRYWQLQFSEDSRSETQLLDEFRALMIDATRVRLRADVPVGIYLSGGLDSSMVAAMVHEYGGTSLETFSIAFTDPEFDESEFQNEAAARWGMKHHVVRATHADIGEAFPEVIRHVETPLLRTAPAPMFLLSRLVHDNGFKVVLSGEGADEFLAGYDIFKENAIRRFWAKYPDSVLRPLLLKKLYPEIAGIAATSFDFLSAFFRDNLAAVNSPSYSHHIRWRTTKRTKRFFSEDFRAQRDCVGEVFYPPEFASWPPLQRAQFLEASIFLPQYLLSSQGDRVAMAHSVEGRFPFLDYRVIEFCNRLAGNLKLRGLKEKYLLRRFAQDLLPETLSLRRKRPYRAPIHRAFFHDRTPDYVREMLSVDNIRAAGMFDAKAVEHLVLKLQRTGMLSETDDMALTGILSAQLVHRQFITNFERSAPLRANVDVKIFENHAMPTGEPAWLSASQY